MVSEVKILIVEDEPVTALDIQQKLESLGYQVTGIARNSEDTLNEVKKNLPDLVLMDIKLGNGGNGIKIAARLRAENKIPVVFLTAFADDETVKQAVETEPYGYIVKPIDESELRTTIEVALHKYRMEKKLRASEERYKSLSSLFRLMADNVPDMIWAKDLEGRYLFANKAICEILFNAKDTEEPVGKTDMFFADRERNAHPDNSDWHTFGELCMNSDEVVIESIKPGRFDEYGNVKGEFLFLDVYKVPFLDETGEMIGTVGSARIVTEEKRLEKEREDAEKKMRQSEKAYRGIFDNAIGAIYIQDREGRFLDVNEGAVNTYGYPKDFFIGKNPELLAAPGKNDMEQIARHIELAYKGEPQQFEFWGVRKNGEVFPQMVRLSRGSYFGKNVIIAFSLDISDIKRAEAAMIELRRAKDTLTDLVVHDIKNISSAMLAWLEILYDGVLGDLTREQRDALQKAIRSNEELFGLSEEMLDIASAEDGKFHLDKKTYVFDDQVKEVVEQFRPTAINEDKNIRFRRSGGPILVLADEYRVKRGISNLVANAIKFVASESGEIYISVRSDEDKRFAVLRVSDNGPGIPEDHREKIFEKFGQVELKSDGIKQGKGLGLTFCKIIAEAHGGNVEVESDGESGSVFIFKLPLYKPDE
ncbi:MAG: PAS domain S-box protein [bacterium]|nr:PAS domain S-box protein [bacterium]